MISHITSTFRTMFAQWPAQVQQQAREAYTLFRQNPLHPSLRWKRVHPTTPIYSVRVGRGHRAVGIREADEVVWFWIGSHAAYDQLLARLWRPWGVQPLRCQGTCREAGARPATSPSRTTPCS